MLVAVGVLLPVAGYLADRIDATRGDLDLEKVADRLALEVRKFWADEAKRREITSPPLAVSWRPASPSLVQPWAYLQQLAGDGAGWPTPAATAAGPQDLAGGGPQILTTYDRTPCGRLVVLGEPGAGKTVLLIRLVLDLLARRQPGEPVPLLVPLASWNPDGPSLTDWLESQILRAYPHLTGVISAGGKSRARALVDDGLILPVLDGLDEIRAGSRTQALAKINATLANHTGIVLSCRAKAFRHAVRPLPGVDPVRLEGAAGVRLEPLDPLAVADYLIATGGEKGSTRWAAARSAMASPGTPLARALVSPLMASLARTIYNPRQGDISLDLPNPTGLTALPSAAAIDQHLLSGFISAAYRSHPEHPTRWDAEQATRYLSFIAHHLEYRLLTTSFTWTEIGRAAPRMRKVVWRTLAVTVPIAIVIVGLIYGFGSRHIVNLLSLSALSAVMGIALGDISQDTLRDRVFVHPRAALAIHRTIALTYGLTAALIIGLVGGFGTVNGIVYGTTQGVTYLVAWELSSAWGQFSMARIYLAARQKNPLRIMAFLEDAHERGVLRQAGAVWEFRHASLQRYLANLP
ncbi:NACHT domain-containing protein [Frankia tisae]|uniref:NACHT domain-containing protein n=1 Tax=Frankia tisae TaxID=2950104 RepID=UPI0021BE5521|nr:NACHT domain-containing protein [Frankia tisae]